MGDRKKYEQRRREYAKRLPAHYCLKCTSVVYPEDESCIECEGTRPAEGWASTQDGYDPWIGRMLDGRYLVTRRVGQGATGSVYRAESLAISREFAVKIINFKQAPAGIEPEQIRARLHREIEAISRLRNPHVVPFYEVIELFDNFVGIVMDFVDGDTLEELVRRDGELSMRRAAQMLRQIANGVHEAHEAGMIHRDLKPENLMVEIMPAGDDFVHILDFGIVQIDDGVSMTRGFLGTPLYASPEQAMAGEVDRRSDIYSLGAIFFFLLTGRPPFISDNVYEILRAHVRTAAPKIDAVSNIDFPPELVELVDAMLAKSPTNRPQTLAEVIHRVDHLVTSGRLNPVDIDPPSHDFVPEEGRRTGSQDSVRRRVKTDAGAESSEGEFHRERKRQSGSFVVSQSRDNTGPKAAIFKRSPSRNSLRELVKKSRETLENIEFDRVLQSDTGVFHLGLNVRDSTPICNSSSDGTIVVVESSNKVYLRRADSSEAELVYDTNDQVTSVVVVDVETALVGLANGSIYRVAIGLSPELLFQDVRRAPITALSTDDDGSIFMAGSESGRVYICRRSRGDQNWVRIQDGPPVLAISLIPNGNLFAVARKHKEVEIYNTSTPKIHFVRFGTATTVRDLAFSSDGQLLAVLNNDVTVALHLVVTGHRVTMLKDASHDLAAICFNEDSELVGFFASDGKLMGLDIQRELKAVQNS